MGEKNMDYKKFEDNLARYLQGKSCDLLQLQRDTRYFKQCEYQGYVFRGMGFSQPIDKEDIRESDICSWSTDMRVAENFASHGRYQIIIIKKSTGISVQKLLDYLKANDLMVSESLQRCTTKYECEVLDSLYISDCSVLEPV